ncbi:MAG: hypothetical protein PWP04_1703 [Candidatus Atribacteria bacterium]|nr:hypothetical protein [Candidatus Atribacteria bacterium]
MIAILSDIHANFPALRKVSEELEKEKVSSLVVLGDIVGYGAKPEDCVQWVVEHNGEAVMGNHEAACVGRLPLDWFNPLAKEAISWTKRHLSTFSLGFLSVLPDKIDKHGFLWLHGSPSNPIEEYIDNREVAQEIFYRFQFWVCFFGHTHVAEAYLLREGKVERVPLLAGGEFEFNPHTRYLVNCGSVGQPRDGNPRASFGLLDPGQRKLIVNRISYPVEEAADEIITAGLPETLAYRLFAAW